MTQVIETYPNIKAAYLTMESCNGGINRNRSQEQACRESDAVIGAEGVDHDTLVAIDKWLATLSEDDLLTFVDGEESEIAAIVASGGEVGAKAHGLFNDLFDGASDD
jgi:hypothetical protein